MKSIQMQDICIDKLKEARSSEEIMPKDGLYGFGRIDGAS
jgi:hypothetical protein